jgi:hypothetical protein
MARLTNQDLHSEINLVKQDVVHIKQTQAKMQSDISMIKEKLLNPDEGAIARVNQNTSFRKNTQKTLWSIWIAILGIIGKMIFWN